MRLAGNAMRKQRERHAPDALTRNPPVGTLRDHVADAALAPGRHPFRLADLAQRGFAQTCLLHADEPLRRRAKNHRRLVTPAMRIAVLERRLVQQRAALLQHRDHVLVRIEHVLAFEQRRARDEAAVAADRIVDGELVLQADFIVLVAVPGRGVHQARAGIERDVIAEHDRNRALVERMSKLQPFERRTRDFADALELVDAGALKHGGRELLGEHQQLGAGIDEVIARFGSRRPRPGSPATSTASSSRSRRWLARVTFPSGRIAWPGQQRP